jgi:hypothetical protein
MGQSTGLSVTATDADNDTLTYSWTQSSPASPQGTLSSGTTPSPTWTAPTVGATTRFTLDVTVSDGKGGTATGHVTVFSKPTSDLSFMADVEPLFQVPCTSCHGGPSPTGGLNLGPGFAYSQLVNVTPTSGCTNMVRVKPGDPDHSQLILRITGGSCGVQMPPGDPTYYDRAPDELTKIRSWIQSGAANN